MMRKLKILGVILCTSISLNANTESQEDEQSQPIEILIGSGDKNVRPKIPQEEFAWGYCLNGSIFITFREIQEQSIIEIIEIDSGYSQIYNIQNIDVFECYIGEIAHLKIVITTKNGQTYEGNF